MGRSSGREGSGSLKYLAQVLRRLILLQYGVLEHRQLMAVVALAWLIPIEDRRSHTNAAKVSDREGLLPTFSLGSYLQLAEFHGPIIPQGKGSAERRIAGSL